MTSGLRRNHRRKYARDVNDHIIFLLVILLAAAIYATQSKKLINKRLALELIDTAVVLFGLVVLSKLLRKLTRHRNTLHESYSLLNNMSGVEFEQYVADLLPSQGYTHIQLTEHYDFGVDIIAKKDGLLWGIQVKRYSGPVKMAAIRQAVAALRHYDCDRAMVITNSSFSASARDLAASNSCILIDGQQLIHW